MSQGMRARRPLTASSLWRREGPCTSVWRRMDKRFPKVKAQRGATVRQGMRRISSPRLHNRFCGHSTLCLQTPSLGAEVQGFIRLSPPSNS